MPEAINPLDNTRIVFDDSGAGEPVVLVHGSGLSKAIWRGLGYTAALRAANHRVIAIDMRGHGRSDKPHDPASYDMPLVLADIVAVLDAAGIHAAHYLGYSFGARAGFSLAHRHPERMLSFISAGGTFRSPGGSVGELFFPEYDSALAVGMQVFLDGWGAAAGATIDPATSAAFVANDPAALRAYFASLEREPGLPAAILPTLATRTLLLAGTRDAGRFNDSAFAATVMPDASFRELVGRDHGSTLRPSAEVLDAVLPFLATSVAHNEPKSPVGA